MLHLSTVRERDLEVGAAMETSEAIWRARDEGGAVHADGASFASRTPIVHTEE